MKPNQFVFVAMLMGVSAVLPSAALATGAIAVDDQVGERDPGYGFSFGYPNQAEAERRALVECRKQGNQHCKVMVWFESCGAYAASKKYYGIGWGASRQVAETKALQQCGREYCQIKISKCER